MSDYFNKIKPYFFVIFGLFMTEVFAACNECQETSLWPCEKDISLGYLQALFGTVEGVFLGTGGQLLGDISRALNGILLSVGGFILLYIVVVSTLNTAHEGEALGRKWSTIWVPLRAVFGLSMLVPQASGYCMAQTVVLWVVVNGVGLGNVVWYQALEYFDTRLPEVMAQMKDDDLLFITADHGCDPSWPGTDHTREYVPILAYQKGKPAKQLGERETFADMGQTIAELFDLDKLDYGTSFLKELD